MTKGKTKEEKLVEQITGVELSDDEEELEEGEQENEEQSVDNNGHKPVVTDEELGQPPRTIGNNGHKDGVSDAALEEFRKREDEKEIPGIKSLYRVDEEWLGEVTDLNDREVAAYSIGDMQMAMGDPHRTKPLFHILKISAFRHKISRNGKGRDDQVILHRLEADMKAQGLGSGGANIGSP